MHYVVFITRQAKKGGNVLSFLLLLKRLKKNIGTHVISATDTGTVWWIMAQSLSARGDLWPGTGYIICLPIIVPLLDKSPPHILLITWLYWAVTMWACSFKNQPSSDIATALKNKAILAPCNLNGYSRVMLKHESLLWQ